MVTFPAAAHVLTMNRCNTVTLARAILVSFDAAIARHSKAILISSLNSYLSVLTLLSGLV